MGLDFFLSFICVVFGSGFLVCAPNEVFVYDTRKVYEGQNSLSGTQNHNIKSFINCIQSNYPRQSNVSLSDNCPGQIQLTVEDKSN